MRIDDTATRGVVAAVAALTLLATVPLGALGTAGGGYGPAPATTVAHGGEGNYTVQPVDDPETAQNSDGDEPCIEDGEDEGKTGGGPNCDPYDGHMPGDTNASYAQFSTGGEAATDNLTETHWIIHEDPSGHFDMSGCVTQDAGVAGIDRGNDDPGYNIDDNLLTHAKNTYEREHVILLEMFREDDLAGEKLRLNVDDQIVARVEDCYTNPSEPGWYQWRGFANGTAESDGTVKSIELSSHYFYICECTSREQAVEQLGPPPSRDPGPGTPTPTPGQSTDTPTAATATSSDTVTPTDTRTPTAGDTPVPGTDLATEPATDSPTPADSPTPTDSPTPDRETDRPGRSTPTATAGDTPTATDAPARPTTAAGTGTTRQMTPTAGSGPGLGVIAALAGLLGSGLWLRRE